FTEAAPLKGSTAMVAHGFSPRFRLVHRGGPVEGYRRATSAELVAAFRLVHRGGPVEGPLTVYGPSWPRIFRLVHRGGPVEGRGSSPPTIGRTWPSASFTEAAPLKAGHRSRRSPGPHHFRLVHRGGPVEGARLPGHCSPSGGLPP